MTTTRARTDGGPPVRIGRHTVTLIAGTWVVLGVFVDGWAHINRTLEETFFTPWHAVLYSGALALFGWLLLPHPATRPQDRAWALAAAGTFGAGGLGDLLWHQAFGVESGLDALVSPTHLLLLLGGLLGVTAPLRESGPGRTGEARQAVPVVASVTLATALGAFFLLYLSPFAADAPTLALTSLPEGTPGHQEAETPAVAGLGAYLVSTVLVVAPVLLLRARGALPFGAVTLLLTTVATLSAGVTQFDQPAAPLAALVAGLAADGTVRISRRLPGPVQGPFLGAVVPLLLWSAQLLALAYTAEVRWPIELVLGAPVLSAILGAVLGHLAAGPRVPADDAARALPSPGR